MPVTPGAPSAGTEKMGVRSSLPISLAACFSNPCNLHPTFSYGLTSGLIHGWVQRPMIQPRPRATPWTHRGLLEHCSYPELTHGDRWLPKELEAQCSHADVQGGEGRGKTFSPSPAGPLWKPGAQTPEGRHSHCPCDEGTEASFPGSTDSGAAAAPVEAEAG